MIMDWSLKEQQVFKNTAVSHLSFHTKAVEIQAPAEFSPHQGNNHICLVSEV